MIVAGVLLAVAFWFLEAAIHAFAFRERPFLAGILPPDANEVWMRFIVCALLVGFGLYADAVVRRIEAINREQVRLRGALSDALAKVLSGYIPICSGCKRIRETPKEWVQIEAFVRDHTEADFTHTLCPDCMKRLYPEHLASREGRGAPISKAAGAG